MTFAVNNQCQATAKRSGKRCLLPAVNGYDVCRVHGGKTPRGVASVNTKLGRYSKDLPTRLAGRFQKALDDPQLGNLKAEIALLDTRIAEMVAGLDTQQHGMVWETVGDARNAIKAAMRSGKADQMIAAYDYLDDVINSANSDMEIWDEVVRLIEQRRKLTDSERKRQVDLEQMITAERAMLLVSALMGVIKEHVTDKRQLAAIAADCRAIYVGSAIGN